MITPADQSDGIGYVTLAARFFTGSDRKGKRATPPLDGSQFVSDGGTSHYGTARPSACRFAADPAHPIGCLFRTSAGAVG